MEIPVGDAASAGFEALSVLRAAALRGAAPLAGQLADRALRVTERGDFAVAQAALQALLRRLAAAPKAGVILARPRRRAVGWYTVGRRERGAPHHRVLLWSIDPIEGSCSCLDYIRASLGLCRHIFLVADGHADSDVIARPPLRWNPVRPLHGAGDWLDRVEWSDGGRALTPQQARARRLFRARGDDGAALPGSVMADPAARLAAVETLLDLVRADERIAEPAVGPLLEREHQRLVRGRDAPSAQEVRRHCDSLHQKLLLYQREGVRRFLERGRLLLADDMGLGKTAQAIAACHVLVQSGRVRRGLIVVPAPLRSAWLQEWRRYTDVPAATVDGDAAERAAAMRRARGGVLIVDEAQMARDLPQLLRFRPDVVVVDEPQRMSSAVASVKRLAARWRLVLTSSSVEAQLDQLAPAVEWVDEAALEPRWRLGWHRDGNERRHAAGDALKQRLASSLMRRGRREVVEQLPARRDTAVPVPLSAAQQVLHDRLTPSIGRIAARQPIGQADFLRLMSLLARQRVACNGLAHLHFAELWPCIERRKPTSALLDSLASPKLGELAELVSALAIRQERKVVVFSQWPRMLRLAAWAVSDLLRAAGLRSVFFAGQDDARRRTQDLIDFHDDPDVRVLFATDAGGVGLDLQRAASCCIHLDLPWNRAVLEQRTGRIGGGEPIDSYALVAEGGIEGRIASLIGGAQALDSELFDGTSETIAFERAGSFLSRLPTLVGTMEAEGTEELDDEDAGGHEGDVPDEDTEAGGLDIAGGSVASLFSQIQVTRRPDGRVCFEAPPPAAAALAELFQAVAHLLAPVAVPDPGGAM